MAPPGVNLCFDDELKAYYDAYISEFALYTSHEGETLTSCQYLNGQYMLIATISHGDYANATGQSFDLDDSIPLVTSLTVDAKTLELYSWQTVARIADGIEIPLSNGSVVYDSTALPDQYYAMADPLATRTITIISDPDTAYAAEQTFTIADSAQPYVIAPDGYVLTVKHGDQYIEPEYPETAAPGNLTFYLIPDA